jgi:hypothetical protein
VTPQFFADPRALRAWFVAHAEQHLERDQRRPGRRTDRAGRMQPAGLAAFEQRRADQSGIYSRVVSAKRAATQERRLAQLVEDSAHGRRLAQLTRP